MSLQRYSAVEMFGAPIEGAKGVDAEHLVEVFSSYGIAPQTLPSEPTDITPYYWQNSTFRYYLTLAHPEGPAVVDLLPRHADSETYLLLQHIGDSAINLLIPGLRHIEIPTDQQAMALVGPGPRFPDKICVHELITYAD